MAYIYEAYRVWSPLDVGAIDDVGRNVISWTAATPEDTGITVSAGLSDADDVEPIEYVECTSGAEIPCEGARQVQSGNYGMEDETGRDRTGPTGDRNRTGGDRGRKGEIDNVLIFSKVLSQSDIKRVMMGLHPLSG